MSEQNAEATRETRPRYERVEEPPDGYVWLRNEYSNDEQTMYELWVKHPGERYAAGFGVDHLRDARWVRCRRYDEERFVTPWTRVAAGGPS